MLLAKIVGTVVATRKDPRLVSSKLLIVRPMDPRGKVDERADRHLIPTPWTPASAKLCSSSAAARRAWPPDSRIVPSTPRSSASSTTSRSKTSHGDESPSHAARPRHRRSRDDAQGRAAIGHQADDRAAADAGPAAGRTADRRGRQRRRRRGRRGVFSSAARKRAFPFYPQEPPADAGIVGIVDHWDLG